MRQCFFDFDDELAELRGEQFPRHHCWHAKLFSVTENDALQVFPLKVDASLIVIDNTSFHFISHSFNI